MIYLQLFWTFLKIGLFTFGGGYAMIALIQSEVTVNHSWLTQQEFTDILAVSQMTPGPVGINTATYTGYTAVVNAGYPEWMGVLGALTASLATILLPIIMMLLVCKLLMKHKDNPIVTTTLSLLRVAIVGLIAAAALLMVSTETFGSYQTAPFQFFVSIGIFVAVFIASLKFKASPILLILLSGLAGLVVYGIF